MADTRTNLDMLELRMEQDHSSREDHRLPRRPQWLVSLDRRAAAPVERLAQSIDEYIEDGNRLPEFRERARVLIRRFFWNVFRGVVNAIASVFGLSWALLD